MAATAKPAVLLLTSSSSFSITNPDISVCRFVEQHDLLPLVSCPHEGTLADWFSARGTLLEIIPDLQRWHSLRVRLQSPWLVSRICRFAAEHEVVLVHALRMSVTPLAVKVAARLKVPCITHLHGVPRTPLKFKRYLIQKADLLIAVSEAALVNYHGRGRPAVAVVYNGLNLEEFRAHVSAFDARQRYAIPREALVVGISGTIPRKGLDLFVEASARIAHDFPAARFLVLGPLSKTEYQTRILARIESLGLSPVFTFSGYQKNVAPFFAAADVWTVPSRDDAAPMVALEAMALGKPVVGSRVGGIPELVQDGVTGTIVPAEDAAALAEAVCALLAEPKRRERLGNAARERVAQEFSFERFCRELGEIYGRLVPGFRP